MNEAATKIQQIISGGQTGADRAALDAAIELNIPHGGYCPAGRRAEDGPIAPRYALTEMSSSEYSDRTKKNVLTADATLILCRGELSGGTRLTRQFARRYAKPLLVIDLDENGPAAVERVHQWLDEMEVFTLNIAGPRESQNAGIYEDALAFLQKVFAA